MPAYSPTPLAQKLGFKPETRYLLIGADLIIFFAANLKSLTSHLPALIPKLPSTGALWIAWPKLASGVPTDLRDSVVRETLLATGLVDLKVCSISDTYSGLKFVRRMKDRPAPLKK